MFTFEFSVTIKEEKINSRFTIYIYICIYFHHIYIYIYMMMKIDAALQPFSKKSKNQIVFIFHIILHSIILFFIYYIILHITSTLRHMVTKPLITCSTFPGHLRGNQLFGRL